MRTAILTIVEALPADNTGARPLALQQLSFAAAMGCRQAIVVAEREGDESLALATRARSLGMTVRFVRDAHGLLGAVSAGEELLVLSPELLPEAPEVAGQLQGGTSILTLPADGAIEAGFERIDGERAWAGVAIIPGQLVERLADLPPDCDAAAALLRIALQAGVRERPLDGTVLEQGCWSLAPGGRARRLSGEAWLRRQLHWRGRHDVTGWAAATLIGRWLDPLLYRGGEPGGAFALSLLLLAVALVLPLAGLPAWGLAALALAVLLQDLAGRLRRMVAGPFAIGGEQRRIARYFTPVVDAVLLVALASAIGGDWMGRLFPPLVLLAALHAPGAERRPWHVGWAADRMALAGLLAIGTALGLAQVLTMVLSLALLVSDQLVARKAAAAR
ncbi:hypothetical protein [Croceibacterium ferulae]|uniref:hypothetical protein n=1 Tax=Croceibacterium ferulae TaxID=1854641 RepID=UPI000EB55DE6|nr:hypothetical protein [Croceibacterium ferulae]